MNRSKSALVALLLTVVATAPATAQQEPLAPQPATSEFCSGCFAYLEFPPLVEADPSQADVRQDARAPIAPGLETPVAEAPLEEAASVNR